MVNTGQEIGEPVDPFGDSAAWDDPEAFYDRPPPARPIPAVSPWGVEPEREGGGGGRVEEGGQGRREVGDTLDTTGDDDCTGGSAYMDTSQFLRTKAPMVCGQPGIDPYFTPDDLPGGAADEEHEERTTPTGDEETPVGFGPYDFPSALANYPAGGGRPGEKHSPGKREGGEDGHDSRAAAHAAGLSYCVCVCVCLLHSTACAHASAECCVCVCGT